MDNFVAMNNLHSSQKLTKDVDSFIVTEHSTTDFALYGVKIPHIAVLHDQEVPIAFWIDRSLP